VRCFGGCRFVDRLTLWARTFFAGRAAAGALSGFSTAGAGSASASAGSASATLGASAGAGFAATTLGAAAGAGFAATTLGRAAGAEGTAGIDLGGASAALAGTLAVAIAEDRHTADPGPTRALRPIAAVNPMANPIPFRKSPRGTGASSIAGCLLRIAIGPVVFRIVDMSPTPVIHRRNLHAS
jgi:hypothetical protein